MVQKCIPDSVVKAKGAPLPRVPICCFSFPSPPTKWPHHIRHQNASSSHACAWTFDCRRVSSKSNIFPLQNLAPSKLHCTSASSIKAFLTAGVYVTLRFTSLSLSTLSGEPFAWWLPCLCCQLSVWPRNEKEIVRRLRRWVACPPPQSPGLTMFLCIVKHPENLDAMWITGCERQAAASSDRKSVVARCAWAFRFAYSEFNCRSSDRFGAWHFL